MNTPEMAVLSLDIPEVAITGLAVAALVWVAYNWWARQKVGRR